MKILSALVLSLGGFSASLQAAVVVPQSNLNCTADINSWGYSSDCGCRGFTRYDERIGACVRGAYKAIRVSGSIVANPVATGGETTGLALQSFEDPTIRYDLVVQTKDFEKLSTLDGLPFEMAGDFIRLPGVEGNPRPAIIVKEINWLD